MMERVLLANLPEGARTRELSNELRRELLFQLQHGCEEITDGLETCEGFAAD